MNRLKLIKRSMYGRAKFDLLKLRVLHTRQKSRGGKTEGDRKQPGDHVKKPRTAKNSSNSRRTTFHISKVA